MLTKITLDPVKTYATEENAVKAVEKLFGKVDGDLRYVVVRNAEGRFYPLFLGESALRAGVFRFGFSIVG